jgi:hypothetical protein
MVLTIPIFAIMKIILISLLSLLLALSSCQWFKEIKAEHHQPFAPHQAKKSRTSHHRH